MTLKTNHASQPEEGILPGFGSRTDALLRKFGLLMMLMAMLVLMTACGRQWATDYGEPLDPAVSGKWRISQVNVSIPSNLTVSEANTFTPNADIVWHGDPPGDRRAQVRDIVSNAAEIATAGMKGAEPAVLDIIVEEFHGVTPVAMARAPSAVYNMAFTAQVLNASTGAALTPPTHMRADLPALVGEAGQRALQFGPTQKEQVTNHLVAVYKGWLGLGPDIRGTFSSLGR